MKKNKIEFPITKKCKMCENMFVITDSSKFNIAYCSDECRKQFRREKEKKDREEIRETSNRKSYMVTESERSMASKARKKNVKEIIRLDAEAKAHGMTYGQYVGLKAMGEWKKHES